jgi:putative oxidoreductase
MNLRSVYCSCRLCIFNSKHTIMTRNNDTGLLLLRLTIGILLLFHGIAKLTNGVSGIQETFAENGLPTFFAYGVYLGEVIAPLMIIFGFRTRIAALLLSFTMLVAIVLAHGDDLFSLGKSGGWAIELPVLFLMGGVVLFFTGAGKYAVSRKKWD